ncbi:MAG: hypothetical protein WAW37_14895 [Syntrophobacteraceae bacterium]
MQTPSIKTIPVADDEIKYCVMLSRVFSMVDCRWDIASGSIEAARSLGESEFDLAISDIGPAGNDGLPPARRG